MKDPSKTNTELIEENSALKQRIKELEQSESDRKQGEEAIHRVHPYLDEILEFLPDATFVIDADGKVIAWNGAMEGMTGVPKEDMIGKGNYEYAIPFYGQRRSLLIDLALLPDEVFERNHYQGVFRQGDVLYAEAYVPQTYKGKGASLWGTSSKLRDAYGNIVGAIESIRDITDRKRAEEGLRQREKTLQAFFDAVHESMVLINTEGTVMLSNAVGAQRLGKIVSEFVGTSLYDHFPPDVARYRKEQYNKVVATGGPVYFEDTREGKSFEQHCYPVFNEEREVSAVTIFAREITSHKHAEAILQESEKKFRLLFEKSVDPILMLDGERFVDCNEAALKIMHCSGKDQLIGIKPSDISPERQPDGRFSSKKADELIGIALKQGSNHFEWKHRTIDGEEFWTDVSLTVIPIGGKQIMYVLWKDISESKLAEEQLQTERETFFSITHNAPYGILVNDPDGETLLVNPEATNITGYAKEDVPTGKVLFDKMYPDPEYRKSVIRTWKQDVSSKSIDRVFSACCTDGTIKDLEFRTFQLPDGKAVTMFLDITDRKRAEEEKRNLQSQLIQSQKMEAIGQLAGGIAHDFNNLLTGIKLHAYLGRHDMDPENPACLKLKNIEEIVDSAANLTKQFLGFARGGKYEVRPTDLNYIINKTVNFFGRTRKEITIHKEYQRSLWAADTDQGQMEQVLLNLFVNAQHAMLNGGDIYIKTGNVMLDETSAGPYSVKPGRYVNISVTDVGTGIDDKIKDRIFEPFFTTKERGIGTGLGLASVYGIVKNHGGYITVDSTLGEGSTFSIFLPASDKKVVRGKPAPAKLLTGTETVLLVDDEKEILNVTNALLEALGYRVHAAENGRQAVETYKTHKNHIALVILDLIMPGMDGEETFENLKKINPDVKVILASGYGMNEKIHRAMQMGCKAFIQKPYGIRAMSAKIREVLGSHP